MTSTSFLILGPLQVRRGGRDIPVRRGKLRALLTMLLVDAGRAVSTDRLVGGLWAGDPPGTATKALQTYVSQLRRLLEPGRGAGASGELLVTEHTGYRLLPAGEAADAVDAYRFERLVMRGSELTGPDPATARGLLGEGLRLWRGPALADVADQPFAETEIVRLEELRLTAVEQRVAADLALCRHELVIAELRELVRYHPLRETLWEHLMVALYRAGQQAPALRAYQDARRTLGDRLGLSPGPALRRVQERILRQDPALDPAPPPVALPVVSPPGTPPPDPYAAPGTAGAPVPPAAARSPAAGTGPPARTAERRRATVVRAHFTGIDATREGGGGRGALAGALRREVGRYGGTVTEATGDALVAVFGAPVAHEDDPERAVRAGLAVRDRVRAALAARTERDRAPGTGTRPAPPHQRPAGAVRVGVDTGEVEASPCPGGYAVRGAAAAGAGLLAGRAAPGHVLVGAATYEATRRGVRYAAVRPPGGVEDLWQVLGVAGEPSRRPLSTTPLVGRAAELRLLHAVWDRVRAARSPHLVTITGPPGIGKSRLVGELVDGRLAGRAGTAGGECLVLRSRCLPYGDAVYGPLAQLVRQVVGVSGDDPAGTVRWRTREWLETHLPAAERARIDEYLVTVLSLLGDIAERGGSTIALLRRLVEVVAAGRPTVLVLDDVHWAHPETLDAVENLAARVRAVPLLIVTVGRPELFAARPGWGGGLPSHTSLPVDALPAGESAELARLLLRRRDDAVRAEQEAKAIEAAAGGSPLFLEELAAWIADGHEVSAEPPATVRAVISARLDTLPQAERRLVVDAAAVGHTFWAGVLAHLGSAGADELPDILDSLEGRGLVVRRPESSLGADQGFAFRHDLIAESAYDLIPPAERPVRHLRIAEYLEARGAYGPAPAVLAHHWKEAGDVVRAVTCLEAAAGLAVEGWERERAVALYQQAMDLIADTDRARWRAINLRRAVALQEWAHIVMDLGHLRPDPPPDPPVRGR